MQPYRRGKKPDPAVEPARDRIGQYFADRDRTPGGPEALLVVGNAPAVGRLLAGWVDEDVAVDRAEMVALVRRRNRSAPRFRPRSLRCSFRRRAWHVWWTLAPRDKQAMQDLRSKLQSKMTVLSVLSGFTAAMLTTTLLADGFLTGPGSARLNTRFAAVSLLGVALVLFVGALVAYDRLSMPARFWAGSRRGLSQPDQSWPVWRPPSSAAWVVYQHSVALWRWVIAGLLLAGAGTGALAFSVVAGDGRTGWVVGTLVALALLAFGWWRLNRPDLGNED